MILSARPRRSPPRPLALFTRELTRTAVLLCWLSAMAFAPAQAAGPSTVGQWSPVYAWPNVAIHLHVLPDGRILTFADDDNPNYPINGARLAGSTKTFVVDIPSGGVPGAV